MVDLDAKIFGNYEYQTVLVFIVVCFLLYIMILILYFQSSIYTRSMLNFQ